MSPEQREQTVQRMRAERDWTLQDIQTRLAELEALSKSPDVSPERKAKALRRFQQLSRLLEQKTRDELGTHLHKAEKASEAITALRTEGSRIPKDTEDNRALRRAKAAEIRAKRREQEAAVKQAETVVAKAEETTPGLKEERLVLSEHILDPNAPAQGSGYSLLDMMQRYFRLDNFIENVAPVVIAAFDQMHASAVLQYEVDVKNYAEKDAAFQAQESSHAQRLEERLETVERASSSLEEHRTLWRQLKEAYGLGSPPAPPPSSASVPLASSS